MTAPIDLIRQSLLNSGITLNQTIYAEDVFLAFDQLNQMVAQWNRKRWLIFNLIDVSVASTGAYFYTVGPGQDIDTPRPDRLEAAYVRLLPVSNNQPLDTWLTIIEAHEDYAQITLKKLQSYPLSIFYDSSFPYGKIYPYPVPTANQYEVHLILKNQITQFADLTTDIVLPPEYSNALMWNLVCQIRTSKGLPPDQFAMGYASTSLNVLRMANNQVRVLQMPMGFNSNYQNNFPPWQAGMTDNN